MTVFGPWTSAALRVLLTTAVVGAGWALHRGLVLTTYFELARHKS